MNDMSTVIAPKCDQITGDDLLAGPRTITITEVRLTPGTEQPCSIFFEDDEGKPWRPCKSMARVLVSCWGPDAAKYVGRTVTLFRDATVKWGGMAVGGIRISHVSDIQAPLTMALTATRGNKKAYTVKPLQSASKAPPASRKPAVTPAPLPEPEEDRELAQRTAYVESIEAKLESAMSAQAMFKIIDAMKENRDVLRQDNPELDARIDAAVRAANVRLAPKDDGGDAHEPAGEHADAP